MIRFIHSSDWQLGMTRAFLHPEADARFAQARIDAISTIGKLAQAHEAAFIVVAGDVFESNQLSEQTLLRALDAMATLPVPIFLLPGNHDPLDAASIFNSDAFANAAEHIIVLRDTTPIPVPGADGVEVVGAPWLTKHPSLDLCAELTRIDPPAANTLRVAVAHGQPDSLAPDTSRPELIALATAERGLAEGQFHYLALGDRHSVTAVGNSGRIWFSGAPVATAFDEQQPNQALLVSLDQASCTAEPLQIGNWHFIAAHRDMNDPGDVEKLQTWLRELPDKERTAIKLSFAGTISLATDAKLAALLEQQAPLFASLKRRQRYSDLAVLPDVVDQDSVSLSGYAETTWNELQRQAADGDAVAGDALRLLYRLSGQGHA